MATNYGTRPSLVQQYEDELGKHWKDGVYWHKDHPPRNPKSETLLHAMAGITRLYQEQGLAPSIMWDELSDNARGLLLRILREKRVARLSLNVAEVALEAAKQLKRTGMLRPSNYDACIYDHSNINNNSTANNNTANNNTANNGGQAGREDDLVKPEPNTGGTQELALWSLPVATMQESSKSPEPGKVQRKLPFVTEGQAVRPVHTTKPQLAKRRPCSSSSSWENSDSELEDIDQLLAAHASKGSLKPSQPAAKKPRTSLPNITTAPNGQRTDSTQTQTMPGRRSGPASFFRFAHPPYSATPEAPPPQPSKSLANTTKTIARLPDTQPPSSPPRPYRLTRPKIAPLYRPVARPLAPRPPPSSQQPPLQPIPPSVRPAWPKSVEPTVWEPSSSPEDRIAQQDSPVTQLSERQTTDLTRELEGLEEELRRRREKSEHEKKHLEEFHQAWKSMFRVSRSRVIPGFNDKYLDTLEQMHKDYAAVEARHAAENAYMKDLEKEVKMQRELVEHKKRKRAKHSSIMP